MSVSMEMQGMDALLRKLRALETRSGRKVLRKGTRAASTPMQKAMRNAAPVGRTGNLRKSIGRRFKFYRNGSTDVGVIGPRINKAKRFKGMLGWIFTFGTKERTIKDWRGLFKRGLAKRRRSAPSGRMPPNPAFKRAVDAVLPVAGQKGVEAIRKALDTEIKALRGGG